MLICMCMSEDFISEKKCIFEMKSSAHVRFKNT